MPHWRPVDSNQSDTMISTVLTAEHDDSELVRGYSKYIILYILTCAMNKSAQRDANHACWL